MRVLPLALLAAALVPVTASAQEANRVTVMAYNAENFFDAADDPRYPNADNAEVINTPEWVAAKAAALARVVSRYDGGKGPDVLILSEVESQAALDAIRNALPNGAAYVTAAFFDADPGRPAPKPDRRGIDVALLSKLPAVAGAPAQSHPVDLTGEAACRDDDGTPGSTRDIIEATLQLPDGRALTVFGAHMPSGRNPIACRIATADRLESLASALPSDRVVVAAGDFNFNCAPNEQTSLRQRLIKWSVPPQTDNGCRGQGSQWFGRDRTWSFLDVIAQREMGGAVPWQVDQRTFHTVLTDMEQLVFDNNAQLLRPKSFRFNETTGRGSGTSDHWPVAVDLVRR